MEDGQSLYVRYGKKLPENPIDVGTGTTTHCCEFQQLLPLWTRQFTIGLEICPHKDIFKNLADSAVGCITPVLYPGRFEESGGLGLFPRGLVARLDQITHFGEGAFS